ncbi:MAG TPA: TolC family outer membrane protein, partial [Rhizomicrobium sp.]|nr:TolC family outer membrane protein [Rhizomicrobium sp.]
LTLQQALGLAYEDNFGLAAQRADLRATDEDVAKALSGWRPSASVSGNYGVENDYVNPSIPVPGAHPRQFAVTVTQPIYSPTTIPKTQQAKADVRAGRARLTSTEEQILFAAAKAYFDVVQAEANVNIQRDHASLLDKQLQDTEFRLSRGDVTRTDLELVRARLNSARAEIAIAEGQLASSRAAFEQVVGRPPPTLDPAPALPATGPTEEAALELANNTNPDLTEAREQLASADAATDVASAQLYPVLSLQGQYSQSQDQIAKGVYNNVLMGFAQIQIPIYQSGSEDAEVRKAKQLDVRASMQVRDIETKVRQNVHSAWQARDAAARAIGLNKQQVDASEAEYRGAEQEVRGGERTTFDLLTAAQDRLTAQLALANSQHDFAVSTFQVLQTTGQLTALGLRLPVKLYDPVDHYNDDATRWFGFGN